MLPTNDFEAWALGYSGCDGGDPGSTWTPATWVCGIEWGSPSRNQQLVDHMRKQLNRDASEPPPGYNRWQRNIEFPFNQKVNKILASRSGYPVTEYKAFARNEQPFVRESTGYFKMNLFPMSFPDTRASRWLQQLTDITGFSDKHEYLQWCREHRFARISEWAKRYAPRTVICLAKTYFPDYRAAFRVPKGSWYKEKTDGVTIRWNFNDCGSLVVVIPFVTSPKGLTSNRHSQAVGNRIRQLECDT